MYLKDPKLLDAWDILTVRRPGGPNNPSGVNQFRRDEADIPWVVVNTDNISIDHKPEHGTSPQYAIRRLRKDRPDLHRQVIDGELSAHAGMVMAGFRDKLIQVSGTDATKAGTSWHLPVTKSSENYCFDCNAHYAEEVISRVIARERRAMLIVRTKIQPSTTSRAP